MHSPRTLAGSLLLATLFASPLAHAQISGGTSGGTGGGSVGGTSTSTTTSPTTSASPSRNPPSRPSAIPGQARGSTAPPSADTIGNARTPSSTTRGDTYDRLPDEPGPDYRLTPNDPLDNNPAAAAGTPSDFPAGNTTPGNRAQRDSEMVPDTERASRGGDTVRSAQTETRREQIRERKEHTAVDTMGECKEAWDPQTHISKDEWKQTCARTLAEPHL